MQRGYFHAGNHGARAVRNHPVMAPWPPCPNAGAARDKLATKMIAMQNSLVLIIPLLLIAEADRPKRSTANPVQSLVRNVS
jgi:hypothetical protein